ncbi:MAG: tellurite resistance TerB family protein [Rhodospirillaceae bacterium]|nr:tellurite resistance TerB family protein [Rhodospirillaceae bacterium]
MIDAHAALVYTMVIVSAADGNMTDPEMRTIGEIVQFLPVFRTFDRETLPKVAADCADLLNSDNGLDRAMAVVKGALPPKLRETAYALACDVAAADARASMEKERILDIVQEAFEIDALVAAAIERAARARHMRA